MRCWGCLFKEGTGLGQPSDKSREGGSGSLRNEGWVGKRKGIGAGGGKKRNKLKGMGWDGRDEILVVGCWLLAVDKLALCLSVADR